MPRFLPGNDALRKKLRDLLGHSFVNSDPVSCTVAVPGESCHPAAPAEQTGRLQPRSTLLQVDRA